MTSHRFAPIVLLILSLLSSRALAQAKTPSSDPPATMQELQQLYDAKDWQTLLQKVTKVLPLRGQAAAAYDRYELLMMKGDAHLNLKQGPAASSTFDEASKIKDLDKVKMAKADGMVLLIKRGQSGVYKRKSPATQPGEEKQFDLTDRDKRKAAFAALAADEQTSLQPRVKSAASGSSLRPIAEILKGLDDLKTAEMAANESTDTPLSAALVAPLASHARELTSREVADMKAKVDAIEKSANQVIDAGRGRNTNRNGGVVRVQPGTGSGNGQGDTVIVQERRYKKRGLIGTDQQTLKNVIETCQNVEQANKQLADVFPTDQGQPLLETAKDAEGLGRRAKTILETDYEATSSDPRGLN